MLGLLLGPRAVVAGDAMLVSLVGHGEGLKQSWKLSGGDENAS